LVSSGDYTAYLATYYPVILFLAVLGGAFTLIRFDPREVGIVVFVGVGLLSLSLFQSLVRDIAEGAPDYERHFVPLLVFVFYLAAVGLVETLRFLYGQFTSRAHRHVLGARTAPIAITVAVAFILTVPGVIAPVTLNLYPNQTYSYADSDVPWVSFSFYPQHPSNLYLTVQSNYPLACNYIKAHEGPGDVVMAFFPGPTTFYLGQVQYWINADPDSSQVQNLSDGQQEFFYTDSILVKNVSEFEHVLEQSNGWIIVDQTGTASVGPSLGLAAKTFASPVPAATDMSIILYNWTRSDNASLMESILSKRIDLQRQFGNDTVAFYNWASVHGVTTDSMRVLMLPIESWLVENSAPSAKPLAVLVNVYNDRPDLQSRFPEVLNGTYINLVKWAIDVDTGVFTDPSEPALLPYLSWYENYTGP
jgi:hypothetical protein